MKSLLKSPAIEGAHIRAMPNARAAGSEGFSLIESLIAILILAVGFMYVGPMMLSSMSSTSLARSKDTAGLAATNQMEALAMLYRANPNDPNLTVGTHPPVQVEMVNPTDNSKVNRYNVDWSVSQVPDPRAGKVLRAVEVTVTATPIGTGAATNVKTGQNKVVNVTSIFSFRFP
jgi:prepilin-type N-terminal cleavage/methylation domain-containing protein